MTNNEILENYLSKTDEELIEEIRTNSLGSNNSKINTLEAILSVRLKQSIEELNKATAQYSKVIIFLTVILLVVSLFQLTASILGLYSTSEEQLMVLIFILVSILVITWILLRKFFILNVPQ